MDLPHAPPLFEELLRLGYPAHLSTLLGTWKVLGALALTAPRRPLLKEWAYAGMFFDLTAAIVAHVAAGDSLPQCIAPAISLVALISRGGSGRRRGGYRPRERARLRAGTDR